jgi:hypothetical protein
MRSKSASWVSIWERIAESCGIEASATTCQLLAALQYKRNKVSQCLSLYWEHIAELLGKRKKVTLQPVGQLVTSPIWSGEVRAVKDTKA